MRHILPTVWVKEPVLGRAWPMARDEQVKRFYYIYPGCFPEDLLLFFLRSLNIVSRAGSGTVTAQHDDSHSTASWQSLNSLMTVTQQPDDSHSTASWQSLNSQLTVTQQPADSHSTASWQFLPTMCQYERVRTTCMTGGRGYVCACVVAPLHVLWEREGTGA